jgi:hypothetical protein
MISRIAMTRDSTTEVRMGLCSCVRGAGPGYPGPNAVNRFAYSNREVLFAM